MGIGFHIAYFLVNQGEDVDEFLILRVLSILTLSLFGLTPLLEKTGFRKFVPVCIFTGLLFTLPFFSTYVLLQTNIQYPGSTSVISSLQLQFSLSVFFIVLLIPHALLTLCGATFSIALAFLVFTFVNPASMNLGLVKSFFFQLSPFWTFVMLASFFYQRNREVLELEKNRAMTAIGSNVAHELRTPLLGIRSRIGAVVDILPELVDSYKRTNPSDQGRKLSDRKLELLRTTCEDIRDETIFAGTLIDMFLVNLSDRSTQSEEFVYFNAKDAIDEAVRRYPYLSSVERKLVKVSTNEDFVIHGSKHLFVHVIFNLLKNSLFYAQKNSDPQVHIIVNGRDRIKKVIEVWDNGPGIPRKELSKVFKRFYTTHPIGGSGIGLSFSSSVVENLGGQILIDSVVGKSTTVKMIFG